ncbi:MAG: pseudouridine synthase [Phycisphaerales bacterium]|jgi:pseudouridine synthase|nr:pseudouridine synthase [Phycisphaerales bacterium]
MQDSNRGPRLQKVLAAAGIGSRRACETLVEEGAVCVNGIVIASLPAWVDPQRDSITVHGSRVRTGAPSVCVMLFKPRGVICTSSDPQERRQAVDLVQHPSKVRLYSIGRLDMDSSGLLLLTNDGELANLLSHPSHHVRRLYEISVTGQVDQGTIQRLERGINLPDERTGRPRPARFHSVRITRAQRDRTTLRVVLTEGRNRQIRRMMLALGHPVRKLRRIAIGPLKLGDLRPGQWRDLTERELQLLRESAKKKARRKKPRRKRPDQSG